MHKLISGVKKVFFIKLGPQGRWNEECIKERIIKVGFTEIELDDINAKRWDFIRKLYLAKASGPSASMYTNQIKNFYEADESILWITFYNQKLWWSFAKQEIYANPDKTKYKKTYTGWSSKDASGKELLMSNLSGTLLAVQGFRSTICNVNESKYVINKIKAACSNEIKKLEEDFSQLAKSVGALIKKLRWKDFELFVDLIFRDMGCQRVGVVGGPQKTIDIELFSPVVQERYLVQVKSETDWKQYQRYQSSISKNGSYDKYYYVYHTTKDKRLEKLSGDVEDNIIVWGLNEISRHAVNAGLVSWLINKAR